MFDHKKHERILKVQAPLHFVHVTGDRDQGPRPKDTHTFALRSHVCGPYRRYANTKKLRSLRTSLQSSEPQTVTKVRAIPLKPKRKLVSLVGDVEHKSKSLHGGIPSDSLRNDPFDSYPVASQQYVVETVDYYVQVLGPQIGRWSRYQSRAIHGVPNPLLDIVFPTALQSDFLFHAIMAMTRVFAMIRSAKEAEHEIFYIFHRGQALSTLQRHLKNVDDDAVPMAILTHCLMERLVGNWEALALHSAGLRRVMSTRAPQRPTPASDFTNLMAKRAFLGLLCGTCCYDHKDTAQDKPGTTLTKGITSNLDYLPVGFHNLVSDDLVSKRTISTIIAVNVAFRKGDDSCLPHVASLALNIPAGGRSVTEEHLYHAVRALGMQLKAKSESETTIQEMDTILEDFIYFRRTNGLTPYALCPCCMIWVACCMEGLSYLRKMQDTVPSIQTTLLESLIDAVLVVRDWNALQTVLSNFLLPECLYQLWYDAWSLAMMRWELRTQKFVDT